MAYIPGTEYHEVTSREVTYKDTQMIDFFYKGGPLMYPLLLGSVLMVTVIVERGYHFIRAKTGGRLVEEVKRRIEEGELEQAEEIARSNHGPVAAIVYNAIRLREYTQDVIENKLSILGDHELARTSLHVLRRIFTFWS